jgi:hypothetical protein
MTCIDHLRQKVAPLVLLEKKAFSKNILNINGFTKKLALALILLLGEEFFICAAGKANTASIGNNRIGRHAQ